MAVSTGMQTDILVDENVNSKSYLYPFILVTCLFFYGDFRMVC